MRSCFQIVIVGMLSFIAGCNSNAGPEPVIEEVVPVSGILTYRGTPLENFQVSFLTEGHRSATGVTDASGKFSLGTNDVGDGAPPGTHKVSVVWVGAPSSDDAGQGDIIDNPALLPKPNVTIPSKYSNPETSGLTHEVSADGATDLKIELQ